MNKVEFIGVYSTRGDGRKKPLTSFAARKNLWFIWKVRAEDLYYRQALNKAYDAVGQHEVLEAKLFESLYTLEEKILAHPLTRFEPVELRDYGQKPSLDEQEKKSRPSTQEIDKLLSSEKARTTSAPSDKLERTLREHFALQLAKLRKAKTRQSIQEVMKILEWKDGIRTEHKHMYTEFGIDLRKHALPELAFVAYNRVTKLSATDSNAWFNLSRICCELGKYKDAQDHINIALELEPEHMMAKKMAKYLQYTATVRAKNIESL